MRERDIYIETERKTDIQRKTDRQRKRETEKEQTQKKERNINRDGKKKRYKERWKKWKKE